jgi:ferredoxin-type protein NapH
VTEAARKPRLIAPVRQVVQLGALALTGEWLWVGALRCPYGIPFMSCGSCPIRVCPGTWLQTWVIGFLVVSGVVAGRVFCGWACPMGAVQDLLGRLPKLRALTRRRFGRADRYLKGLKYGVLLLTIVAFYLLNERFAVPVRGHGNWSLDAVRVAWLTYDTASRVRVIALLAGVVLALGLTRAWCRYLCPLGALLTLGNRISVFRLRRDRARCVDCGKYPRDCRTYTTPGTADCVICGDCIEGCARGAISIRPARLLEGKPGETVSDREAVPTR